MDMTSPGLIDEDQALRALAGLAQAQRLRIFRNLIGAGPAGLTPTALAHDLGMPPSTLSFHLKELAHAGLVTQQRSGRHLIYRPELAHMNALMHYLTAHCCDRAMPDSNSLSMSCGPQTAAACC